MNRSDFVALFSATHTERTTLLIDKSADYAGEDVLSNFKRMSQMSKLLRIDPARSATDAAWFLALLKFDRLTNLAAKGVEPKNESVKDSYHDFHNYLDLAQACSVDKE